MARDSSPLLGVSSGVILVAVSQEASMWAV